LIVADYPIFTLH